MNENLVSTLSKRIGDPLYQVAVHEERLCKEPWSAPSAIAVFEIYFKFSHWMKIEMYSSRWRTPAKLLISTLNAAPDLMTKAPNPSPRGDVVIPSYSTEFLHEVDLTPFWITPGSLLRGLGQVIPKDAVVSNEVGCILYFDGGGSLCFCHTSHPNQRIDYSYPSELLLSRTAPKDCRVRPVL